MPRSRLVAMLLKEDETTVTRQIATSLETLNADANFDFVEDMKALKDCCLHYIIKHHAAPFRGRYRWSAFFIEELLNRTFQMGVFEASVSDVLKVAKLSSEKAKTRVCNALKNRLRRLDSDANYHDLVNDLFKMAWRAYILRMPSICTKPDAGILITEGFALTTQRKKGAALDEPLAVEAVMQFLRQNKDRHQQQILEMISHSQFDREKRRLYGKMHEQSIAMVCYT